MVKLSIAELKALLITIPGTNSPCIGFHEGRSDAHVRVGPSILFSVFNGTSFREFCGKTASVSLV